MLLMILSTSLALAIGVTIHADMAAGRARGPSSRETTHG
jgi:hypothetical protein